ncbi:MAG TPA: hypothetical protein VFZ40_21805 [Pyrinomonadaceae bacterium]
MPSRKLTVLSLSLFIAVGVIGLSASAQSLTGEWKGSLVKDKSKVNLNFAMRRETDGDKKWNHTIGHTFEFSELGLNREQVLNGGPVSFRLTREAGTIEGEGTFQNEKGTGTYRFIGNTGFLAAMKTRGFDFEKESGVQKESRGPKHESTPEERLFTAAVLNVTTALADDLRSANFPNLDVGDLFKAAIFKIDGAFMREMKSTGFPNLTMEDLVKARIFKIDAAAVRRATEMGFGNQGFESLVKMSIFKVTPEFLAEVRNEGLTNLTMEEVVKLRIFKIDGEFIRKAKGEGVPVTVESLVQRKLGVSRAPRPPRPPRVRTRTVVI